MWCNYMLLENMYSNPLIIWPTDIFFFEGEMFTNRISHKFIRLNSWSYFCKFSLWIWVFFLYYCDEWHKLQTTSFAVTNRLMALNIEAPMENTYIFIYKYMCVGSTTSSIRFWFQKYIDKSSDGWFFFALNSRARYLCIYINHIYLWHMSYFRFHMSHYRKLFAWVAREQFPQSFSYTWK